MPPKKATSAAGAKKAAAPAKAPASKPAAKKVTKVPAKKAAAPAPEKKAPVKKAAAAKKVTPIPAPKTNGTKRARSETESESEKEEVEKPARQTKKAKVEAEAEAKAEAAAEAKAAAPEPKPAKAPKAAKPAPAPKVPKPLPVINNAPTQKLDIWVCGEGSSGELGLGSKKIEGKKPIDVKRPRYNPLLSAKDVGVVQISVGGMHCAALTFDNKILTWGVNDNGALGRDTTWDGGLVDLDKAGEEDSDDEDSDDTGVNPVESTPTEIDMSYFPPNTKFTQVVTSDSATFVLTDGGLVYGWGQFRGNEGVLGFTQKVTVSARPMHIPELKKIKQLAAGANHIIALDHKGNVFAWGSGQQSQLGRRIVERTRSGGLVPREFGLPKGKVVSICSGSYHSFAIDNKGQVWAWGLNNFAETGISEGAGEDNASIDKPTIVNALESVEIVDLVGGGHHSLACTQDGKLLAWGRIDAGQCGIDITKVPEDNVTFDEHKVPRILAKPTEVPGVSGVVMVDAASDTSFAVTKDGKAYSFGFSANYQTGQGTDDDIKEATLIDNTAVRDRKITFCGVGGQFAVLAGPAEL